MNAHDTQQKIAAALAREEPPLSSAECNALLVEFGQAFVEASERLNRTRPGDAHHQAGAERLQALRTGSPEDVRRVNDEYETTRILVDQLQAQRDALHQRRSEARLREAREGMPRRYEALIAKLDAAEAAKAALRAALGEVKAAADQITAARATIRYATQAEPEGGATVRTLQRLAALDSAKDYELLQRDMNWLDLVGCAASERIYKEAQVKVPDADYSDCETDADVMRRAVETLFGPRDEGDAEVARAFAMLPADAKKRMAA